MSLGRFNTLRGFWPRARNTWICMTSQPVLRSLLCPGAIQGRSSSLGRGLVDPMWIAIQPSIVTGCSFTRENCRKVPRFQRGGSCAGAVVARPCGVQFWPAPSRWRSRSLQELVDSLGLYRSGDHHRPRFLSKAMVHQRVERPHTHLCRGWKP